MKKMLYIILAIIGLISIIILYTNHPKFGKIPTSEERLRRILQSPNYKNGKFHNISSTPTLSGDKNIIVALYEFFFKKPRNLTPSQPIPSIKTDLNLIPTNENMLVWLGHSAYYMQIDGKRFLVDPTLITASPLPFMLKPFSGSDIYKSEDIPNIDYLFITHDHWDHLDYETIKAIQTRVSKVICPLGVGEHFKHWGFKAEQIIELDWQEKTNIEKDIEVTALPARHGSGRGFISDKSLWASFMLKTPNKTIYIGGDSGYDKHFDSIAQQFPSIDWAILENGQYDNDWAYIHILPEQLPQIIKTLNAKRTLTFHNSKFALAKHSWNDPLIEISKSAEKQGLNIATPMIGEIVNLDDYQQTFKKWWESK